MQVDCPKGWKWVKQIGNITFEDSRVHICDGVCDSADLCKRADCEFHDVSEDATRRLAFANAGGIAQSPRRCYNEGDESHSSKIRKDGRS